MFVERDWIERIFLIGNNGEPLSTHDAEIFATKFVTDEWELLDSEPLNYDRVAVRFEGAVLQANYQKETRHDRDESSQVSQANC